MKYWLSVTLFAITTIQKRAHWVSISWRMSYLLAVPNKGQANLEKLSSGLRYTLSTQVCHTVFRPQWKSSIDENMDSYPAHWLEFIPEMRPPYSLLWHSIPPCTITDSGTGHARLTLDKSSLEPKHYPKNGGRVRCLSRRNVIKHWLDHILMCGR
jgi:hypothetical protein